MSKTLYSYQDKSVRLQLVEYDNLIYKIERNRRVEFVGSIESAKKLFVCKVKDLVVQQELVLQENLNIPRVCARPT